MIWALPLLAVAALVLPVLVAPVSPRTRRAVSRTAVALFGQYVSTEGPTRSRQVAQMRAAHVGGTHRAFASRTLLYAAISGVAGSVGGVYLAGWLLRSFDVDASSLREALPGTVDFLANLARLSGLHAAELFGLLVFAGATVGVTTFGFAYWGRWAYLNQRAEARATEIEATLPRTVAFVYALSRSGMAFPTVLETLTRNRGVYGEAAREMGVAVRDMNAFGTDVLTALRETSTRTPSESFEEFSENLASVLGSGQSLSSFLREQYDRYRREAAARQEQYLELLSTFAEIYVTVLVAGPLFFITVLVVIGLVIENTLPLLQLVAYVAIPLGTAGFIVHMNSLTQSLRTPTPEDDREDERGAASLASAATLAESDGAGTMADGGTAARRANWERLVAYDRYHHLRDWLERPLENVLRSPATTLIVTVPLALVWVFYRAGPPLALAESLGAALTAARPPHPDGFFGVVDGPLVEATVFVLGVSAVTYEVSKRRQRAFDESVPDFLDRLASVNEAGLTVVRSIERVAESDLGALTPEIRRTRADIRWGADVQTALRRLERRTGTAMISRAVTLITNAMAASGDVAPVLRIAASEAQDSYRLYEDRRRQMLTYLIVIYLSFLVFLGIVGALKLSFIPAIEQAAAQTTAGSDVQVTGGVLSGLQSADTAAFQVLFFHVTAIQGLCSGLVAGLLGEGSVADGLKHATVLLTLSYVVFAVL
jgi:flagellar protein FlaJ